MKIEALLDHHDFVVRRARSLVRGAEEAEDYVQETYLAAATSPPRHAENPRGWLARVLRNAIRMGRRGGARRAVREAAAARGDAVPGPREILAREEVRRRVLATVVSLEPLYRDVVVLRYLEELPPREIARRLGLPVATVKTRLKRALAMLRGRLDDDHDGDRLAWTLLLLPLAGRREAAPAGLFAAAVVGVGAVLLIVAGAVHSAGRAPAPARPDFAASGGDGAGEVGARSSGTIASGAAPAAPDPETAAAASSAGLKGGRVVDEEGRPVPGALLFGAGSMSGTGSEHRIPREWDRADEEGRFRVSPIWGGRDVFAAVPGEAVSAWTRIERGTEDLDLVVGPGAAVRGTVRDVGTGEPIPSARVELVVGESANPPLFVSRTGPAGEYRFDGVPTGVVVHPRLASSEYAMTEGSEEFVDLANPSVLGELRREGRARGFDGPGEIWTRDLGAHAIPGTLVTFVLKPGTLPLPDVLDLTLVRTVRLPLAEEAAESYDSRTVGADDRKIDIHGRWKTYRRTQSLVWHIDADLPELTLRLPRGETRFRVRGRGIRGGPPPLEITGEEEPFRIEVPLERELRIVGRLVDEEGMPVRRAEVRVWLYLLDGIGGPGEMRTSNEEGRVDFTSFAPPPDPVMVECDQLAFSVDDEALFETTRRLPSRVIPRDEYLRLGAAAESGELVLDVPVRKLGELTFLVVDRNGKPQPDVPVRLVDDGFQRRAGRGADFLDDRLVSDENGRILVRLRSVDFRRGEAIVAERPWRGWLQLKHLESGDEQPFRIRVERVSLFEITILDEDGRPLSNRDVHIAGQSARTDTAGVVRLDLRSDRTGASVATEGWLTADARLDPETRTGTVRLERGRVIEFECPYSIDVEFYDASSGRRLLGGSYGGSGVRRETFPRVPLRISATEDGGEGSADVLVPLDQDRVRIVLEKRPPVRARLVLVDPRGAALPDVEYAFRLVPGNRRLEGRTGSEGGFELDAPPGTYTVYLEGCSLLRVDRQSSVRIEAGTRATIRLARLVSSRVRLPAAEDRGCLPSVALGGTELWTVVPFKSVEESPGELLLWLPVGRFTLRVEAGDREVGRTSWDGDPPERIDFR